MPVISVVIPTRDRGTSLARTLESLCCQSLGRDQFEVIVVDDGSRRPLDLASFMNRLGLSLVRQDPAGPSTARNHGAGRARGELLVFLDDDCTPLAPTWLEDYLRAFRDTPEAALGGPILPPPEAGAAARVSEWIVQTCLRHFLPRAGGGFFLPSGNLAVPAKLFRRLGGFDPQFRVSEDRELLDRWLCGGLPARALAGAGVTHHRRLSLWGFVKAHVVYGRGAYRFHQVRYRRRSGRWGWDYLTYYLAVFWRCPVRPRAYSFFLLALWQVANLLGFTLELARDARLR